jgi:hypothetical protein
MTALPSPRYGFPRSGWSRPGVLGVVAAVSAGGLSTLCADDGNWANNFRLGAVLGFGVSANFHYGGVYAAPNGGVGATGVTGVNHVYDDGYVKVDATGNAGGYTSNFGYESAAQYNASAQTLTMHHLDAFSTSGGGVRTDSPFIGFDLTYGSRIADYSFGRIGWEVGFDMAPFTIKDNETLTGTFTRSAYLFDASGLNLPTAPYHGGSSGLGPTLRDVATAGSVAQIPGVVQGSHSLQGDLYLIRLGATWFFPLGDKWMVSAAAGPVLGVASANYRFNENFTFPDGSVAASGGRHSGTTLSYGGYAAGFVYFRVQPGADLFAGAQGMSLDTTHFGDPGRVVDLRMGRAFLLTAGFSWPF